MGDIVQRLRHARNWLNGGECCGDKDSAGICAAPACIYGEALTELYTAADEIERLNVVIQTAFGLLWHDWVDEARVHLSKSMSMDDKAKGIGIAKTYPTDKGPVELPAPIARALEALNNAAIALHWEDDDTGWVKYRAAEVTLRHWAEGVDAWVKES